MHIPMGSDFTRLCVHTLYFKILSVAISTIADYDAADFFWKKKWNERKGTFIESEMRMRASQLIRVVGVL